MDVHADFLEGACLEQRLETIAGRHLAMFTPGAGLILAAASQDLGLSVVEILQDFDVQGHGRNLLCQSCGPAVCEPAPCWFHICCSSTRQPLRSFGCKNRTGMS